MDFGVVVVHNWQLIFVHTPEPAGSSFAQLASFGILSVHYKQSLIQFLTFIKCYDFSEFEVLLSCRVILKTLIDLRKPLLLISLIT